MGANRCEGEPPTDCRGAGMALAVTIPWRVPVALLALAGVSIAVLTRSGGPVGRVFFWTSSSLSSL